MNESLKHLGRDGDMPFELAGPLEEMPVKFRFAGHFEGRPVIWNAELWPVGEWPDITPCPDPAHQFMIIGPEREGHRRLVIALDVGTIDESTLLKSVIMVRKYRRLREGVICFSGRRPGTP